MNLKNFPINVHDFAQIRENGYYYVDKTALIHELVHANRYYILTRPRQFGKSLLISTFQCYFEGCKDLFMGLSMEHLETKWCKHPVIHLDMKDFSCTDIQALSESFEHILHPLEEKFCIKNKFGDKCWALLDNKGL